MKLLPSSCSISEDAIRSTRHDYYRQDLRGGPFRCVALCIRNCTLDDRREATQSRRAAQNRRVLAASLYLCIGMLYLKANPLLREPLRAEHTKPRLLGHWGSDAGQCFTYVHFNRLIKKHDLNAIHISGPGAPAVLSQALSRGDLFGDLSRQDRRLGGDACLNHADEFGIDSLEIWQWPF